MIKYLVCRFNRLPPSPSSNPISAGCDGLFVDWSGDWDLSPTLEKYDVWGLEFLYVDSPLLSLSFRSSFMPVSSRYPSSGGW